ncbi:MAG: hypothetical protein SPK70_00660 [Succinivibrio dextrinosolvens]|nr:hypothetical protein [Succinivibrio dextrinosolvens]MDY6466744.1 hypothetical protein [Succinivibrio dextrinosolvens]MDY6469561.1 hypothetical protein [Succinivibrio dextrinosolvens]
MELNLTKKTELKKFFLTDNKYSLNDLKKIEKGLSDIIKVLEEREEALRLKEEQKREKVRKVIAALESEGVTFDELQSYIGKGKKKVKKTEVKKEDKVIDATDDLEKLTDVTDEKEPEDNKLIS